MGSLDGLFSKILTQNATVTFQWGVVTAKRSSPRNEVDITLAGSPTVIEGVVHLHSYAPQVDDVVLVLINDTDIIVLGNMA